MALEYVQGNPGLPFSPIVSRAAEAYLKRLKGRQGEDFLDNCGVKRGEMDVTLQDQAQEEQGRQRRQEEEELIEETKGMNDARLKAGDDQVAKKNHAHYAINEIPIHPLFPSVSTPTLTLPSPVPFSLLIGIYM